MKARMRESAASSTRNMKVSHIRSLTKLVSATGERYRSIITAKNVEKTARNK
ncbi:MAG: hypothetical protein HA496_01310 [Thaumarchaeota archaeon]|jgi:hypothetical protein|nr:hypothetical protein [Nitrososphaerota archaeon]